MKTSTVVDLTGAEVTQRLTAHARKANGGRVDVTPNPATTDWKTIAVSFHIDKATVLQVIKDMAGEHLASNVRMGSSEVNIKLTDTGGIESASVRFSGSTVPTKPGPKNNVEEAVEMEGVTN